MAASVFHSRPGNHGEVTNLQEGEELSGGSMDVGSGIDHAAIFIDFEVNVRAG